MHKVLTGVRSTFLDLLQNHVKPLNILTISLTHCHSPRPKNCPISDLWPPGRCSLYTQILCVLLFAGGHSTFFGLINTFVHVVMYTYYLLAAMGPKYQKYIWWKKYLTTFQMVSCSWINNVSVNSLLIKYLKFQPLNTIHSLLDSDFLTDTYDWYTLNYLIQ